MCISTGEAFDKCVEGLPSEPLVNTNESMDDVASDEVASGCLRRSYVPAERAVGFSLRPERAKTLVFA